MTHWGKKMLCESKGSDGVNIHVCKHMGSGVCPQEDFKPGVRQPIWPMCAWFLKIDPVQIVRMHVCVCLHPRLLITSGVMRHDMNPIQLHKQVLQLLYSNCR